jgi:translocation and assembly module TamA
MRPLLPSLPLCRDRQTRLLPEAAADGGPKAFLGCSWLVLLLLVPWMLVLGGSLACAHPNLILNIEGNLSDSQHKNIRSYLSLTRLADHEPLTESVFRRLYRKIPKEAAKALEPFGYYDPEISSNAQQLQPGKWQVNIKVQPGEPIRISTVDITLSGPGAEDEQLKKIVAQFPLHKGDILHHQTYSQGKDRLIASILENGYQQAGFQQSRVKVSKRDFSAAIQLKLTTGPCYHIGPIAYQADFIDKALLKKINPVQEGDPFSPKALTRMRQSFFNAGYFDSVDLHYDLAQAQPGTNKVPVTIVLTPNLTHKYGLGLGYGTDTGPRGTLEYTNRHINRFGHQLELKLRPSQRKNNLGSMYTIPIGDPKQERLSITGEYKTESFDNTETQSIDATISHDRIRTWGEYSTYLEFLSEDYDIGSDLDSDQTSFIIPGIKGSVFWARDRIATDKGLRLSAKVFGSEKNVLGDADFIQIDLQGKGIYRFSENWRFIGRTEVGTTLIDDIYDLPPTLRFYAGGDQSVRGYGYKKIAPTDSEGNLMGAKNILTYSLELERKIYQQWSGAAFYDSGMAMNSFSDLTMHSGAGVGLRWSGIFGQVRLDLAKALDEDGSWRIHFSLGADL